MERDDIPGAAYSIKMTDSIILFSSMDRYNLYYNMSYSSFEESLNNT